MTQPNIVNAIYSTLVAVVGALATVMVGDVTISDVTQGQWVVIAGAALAAFGGAYGFTRGTVQSSTVAVVMDNGTPVAGPASSVATGAALNPASTVGDVTPVATTGGTTGDL